MRRREFLATLTGTLTVLAVPPGCGDARRAGSGFLQPAELETLEALCDCIFPADRDPGAVELGAAQFIDRMLSAFDGTGTSLVYAGGPFSDRNPFPDNDQGVASRRFPENSFVRFVAPSRLQELRWRAELFGTAAVPGADFNDGALGPMRGLRDIYREGLARVDEIAIADGGDRFARLSSDERTHLFEEIDRSFTPEPRRGVSFTDLLIQHTLQGCLSAPEYGGNRRGVGWQIVGLEGDNQPLGFSIYSRERNGYVERQDHPMSTANPDELGEDGSLVPRPLSADAERIQLSIMTLASALGEGCGGEVAANAGRSAGQPNALAIRLLRRR